MGSDSSCCKAYAMEEKENGLHVHNVVGSARCDDKVLDVPLALNWEEITERSPAKQSSGEVSCDPDKGKRVLQGSEVEHLDGRLKVLEEEVNVMKQAFFKGAKERKELVNEIRQQFQFILHVRNQGTEVTFGERSLTDDPPKEGRTVTGLLHVLHQNSNPFLVIREHVDPGNF